jgi:hypothetical protein
MDGTISASPTQQFTDRRALWRLHPRADYYLAHGGDQVAPPIAASVVITNKCNLRCEICGSQKFLDNTKTARTHMTLETFQGVAATLFPLVHRVELNSQGDPLLNPDIMAMLKLVATHRCHYRIQTNGTLFTDEMIEFLADSYGDLSLSIDAVGPLFDQVRRNGVWEKAEPMMRKLRQRVSAEQVTMMLYPTVTGRTVAGMLDVVKWASDVGVERVDFHEYQTIQGSFETVPEADAVKRSCDAITDWYTKNPTPTWTMFDGRVIGRGKPWPHRFANNDRVNYIDKIKAGFPLPVAEGDPVMLCGIPNDYIDIGMQGQINACCRAQTTPLGFATSPEAFVKSWLGPIYQKLRQSLRRDSDGIMPLPECVGCVKYFVPAAAEKMRVATAEDPIAFIYDEPEIPLTFVRREEAKGNCFTASVPLGMVVECYELLEDGKVLPHRDAVLDDIRGAGTSRWRVAGNKLYFATSDNSDPLRNDRNYILRRIANRG